MRRGLGAWGTRGLGDWETGRLGDRGLLMNENFNKEYDIQKKKY